jgi:hypothetical protein
MQKQTFLEILTKSTPESLNAFLEEKGKQKLVCPIVMINKETEVHTYKKV